MQQQHWHNKRAQSSSFVISGAENTDERDIVSLVPQYENILSVLKIWVQENNSIQSVQQSKR